MDKLKVALLFCGCGGTDVGLLGGFDFLGQKYNMEIVYAMILRTMPAIFLRKILE